MPFTLLGNAALWNTTLNLDASCGQVYDEFDEEVQTAEDAETSGNAEDADRDIRPSHRSHHRHKAGGAAEDGAAARAAGDDDDEDDEYDDEEIRKWNLRKCSAAGLDMLSNVYGDEILPVLLPIVEARLQVGKARDCTACVHVCKVPACVGWPPLVGLLQY